MLKVKEQSERIKIINKLREEFSGKIEDEKLDTPESKIAYLLGVIDTMDSQQVVFQ